MIGRSPRDRLAVAVGVLAILAGALPRHATAAQQPPSSPRIDFVRCWPTALCGPDLKVPEGGSVLITGEGISSKATVHFAGGAAVPARRLRTGAIVVPVPPSTQPGPVRVSVEGAGWSNSSKPLRRVPTSIAPPRPSATPFDGNGMWIWEIPRAEGGNVARIIKKAQANGVNTLFIKSGDGDHTWRQFNAQLLKQLRDAGLLVCAWPYVYGKDPRAEAKAVIKTLALKPDCLAIDAETEYEGRYTAASIFISAVRRAAGPGFPISLAGYPYVDYHPSFPYSVFFQPGGAQFNQPQTYWQSIGRSVDEVLSHTWRWNQPYGRPIVPLGELWQKPKPAHVDRFRSLSMAWGSSGFSWWDWRAPSAALWPSVGKVLGWPPAAPPAPEFAELAKGSRGDLVRWLQMRLRAAGARVPLDGGFGTSTRAAVMTFQSSHRLVPTGVVNSATWRTLLRVRMPLPEWARPKVRAAALRSPDAPPSLSWRMRGRSEFSGEQGRSLSRRQP